MSEQADPVYYSTSSVLIGNDNKMSQSRQNYHEESEALVNRQINMELNAYYQYLALVSTPMHLQSVDVINLFQLGCVFQSR